MGEGFNCLGQAFEPVTAGYQNVSTPVCKIYEYIAHVTCYRLAVKNSLDAKEQWKTLLFASEQCRPVGYKLAETPFLA